MEDHLTHSHSHSLSNDLDENMDDTHVSGPSTRSTETRGPSIGISEEIPNDYQKKVLTFNSLGQPTKAVDALGKMFAFEHLSSIDIDWTRNKFRLAWKEYKHELYNKYIKDQPPSIVKENPQDGIPLQDWRRFVDNCHSEKFKENTQQCHSFTHSFSRRRRVLDQPTASFILVLDFFAHSKASSLRNSANRKNQKNSSCLGRKSAAVAREEMAMAKGVPESSIGRVESYKFIHKRKSGVAQDPELVEKLDNYTTLHPESVETSVDDALTQRDFEARGRVCKTTLKKMKPVMQQNIALMEKNTSLEKKVDVLRGFNSREHKFVLKAFMSQGANLYADVSSPCSSHARYTPLHGNNLSYNDKWGIVQDVDHTIEFGDRRLEEGTLRFMSMLFMAETASLPLSHDAWKSKLGEIA
ncbi:hypothetical protein IFM89_010485 [Coptis chinensis]|uniref:Uncharacterized protein n=1 Tax=Coptis chinensis TaxID=261450 RepID=A0A835I934_9MAGN|nr:hypothetical protein IFM89_010485 [Coptis chinensis]